MELKACLCQICNDSSTRNDIPKLGLTFSFISHKHVFVCTIRFTFLRSAICVDTLTLGENLS